MASCLPSRGNRLSSARQAGQVQAFVFFMVLPLISVLRRGSIVRWHGPG